MTGSIALDVVIGLVFVFLLYSLFASIIQEIVASILGLRARNLRHALTRMLEDDKGGEAHNIVTRAVVDSKERLQRNFKKKGEGLLKEFYNQPIIKYLASGRYNSKPSYINQSDFSKAIMEILKEKGGDLLADENGNSTASILDKITSALKDSDLGEETKKHLKALMENAENDLKKFEGNLEEWFNNMMERASGWYKKTIQFTLFLIGLFIAISFNADTINIVKVLSTDKDARDAMVEMASNYVEENKELIALLDKKKEEKENAVADSSKVKVTDTAVVDIQTKIDSLLQIKGELQTDIDEANQILGFRPNDDLPLKKAKPGQKLTSKQRMLNGYVMEFSSAEVAENVSPYYEFDTKKIRGKEVPYAEFKYVAYMWNTFWDRPWGFILTALAISLGAPFWFDLLNRLIRIRNSVQSKPQEESNS